MKNMLPYQLDQAIAGLAALRQVRLRAFIKSVARATGKAGPLCPTPEQYEILLILDSFRHGIPVRRIADESSLPHANVTRTLDRMEKRGLIHRVQDRTDKRRRIVRLTLEGGRAVAVARQIQTRLLKSLWDRYNEADQALLFGLLTR